MLHFIFFYDIEYFLLIHFSLKKRVFLNTLFTVLFLSCYFHIWVNNWSLETFYKFYKVDNFIWIKFALVLFFLCLLFFVCLDIPSNNSKYCVHYIKTYTIQFHNWLNFWKRKTMNRLITNVTLNSWSFNCNLIIFQFFINRCFYYHYFICGFFYLWFFN